MKKFWNIGAWVGGLGLMITLLAFGDNCRKESHIKDYFIEIDHETGLYFVHEADVEKIIRSEYPYLDSLLCREINISLLEERLDNHPSIHKAEVYSALDGILRIHISQRRPVFRVQNEAIAYYVDEIGDSMALSPHYSAKVPLVTGQISAETEAEIFEFFMTIENDGYFNDFFHGLHVNDRGYWTLYPKPGNHQVLLGEPEELDEKLRKLKVFYDRVVNNQNIDSIKVLNLSYNRQVVCTKY